MPQENWNADGVSTENSTYVTEKNWANNDAMVTSMRELETKIGGSIIIPTADASDDDRNAFYKQLGRPDNASQYGYKMPEGGDKDYFEWFTNTAHKIGLSDAQTSALGLEADKRGQLDIDNNVLLVEKETQALKDKYGADYDSKIAKGSTVIKNLGLTTEALGQIEQQIGTGAFVDLFISIGEKIDEGAFIGTNANPNIDITLSKAQALEQINRFDNDKATQELYKANDKQTLDRRRMLYKIAYD